MIRFKELSLTLSGRSKQLDRAQDAIDKKVIELLEAYTPEAMPRFPNHGKMKRSHKQESPGVIVNTEPRARREYYTNKGASGPKRGKYWLVRMKADRLHDVRRAAEEEMK